MCRILCNSSFCIVVQKLENSLGDTFLVCPVNLILRLWYPVPDQSQFDSIGLTSVLLALPHFSERAVTHYIMLSYAQVHMTA